MSSVPPNDSRSHSEPSPADPGLTHLVRARGAPLLQALEEHLPGSMRHAEATGEHAFAAAIGLGLHPAVAELHRETAKLHDIGMVYVPRDVALTPHHELGDAGRDAFEGHYEAGAKLALGARVPGDVCGWLERIRERYDGRGPEGLGGTGIPIASRITRVACAYDLLLASASTGTPDERRSEAIARLSGAAEAELDPAAVEALVAAETPAAGSDARA